MAKIRIDKMLSHMGYGSRSDIKKAAKMGRIRLNQTVEKNCALLIDPQNVQVFWDDMEVIYREHLYLLLNKPQGVVSATQDNLHPTVIDLVPENYRHYNLFPVGRLDKDTEGLLVLTNDGPFAHDLLSPKKQIPKIYYAQVDVMLSEAAVRKFEEGILLDDGYKTMPAKLEIFHVQDEQSHCHVTIQEGKFHQIKRMFAEVGAHVLFLKRIQIGKLRLDERLAPGEMRELTAQEIGFLTQR